MTTQSPPQPADVAIGDPLAGEIAALQDALKRCSPATAEAAFQYRRTRDASLLDAIVLGVVER